MTNVLWALLLVFFVIVGILSVLTVGTMAIKFIIYIHNNIKNILEDLVQE